MGITNSPMGTERIFTILSSKPIIAWTTTGSLHICGEYYYFENYFQEIEA